MVPGNRSGGLQPRVFENGRIWREAFGKGVRLFLRKNGHDRGMGQPGSGGSKRRILFEFAA